VQLSAGLAPLAANLVRALDERATMRARSPIVRLPCGGVRLDLAAVGIDDELVDAAACSAALATWSDT
jgi:hypothetical protein